MSEKTFSFMSKEEWDMTKHVREKTPEYVNNFLHHEGLLCLTDHQWYFLAPNEDRVNILPDLRTLNVNEDLRVFWVQDPFTRYKSEMQVAIVTEMSLNEPHSQLDYPEIFLNLMSLFREKNEIRIYWDGVPAEELGETVDEEELTEEEREVAFEVPIPGIQAPSTAIPAMVGQVKANDSDEEEAIPVLTLERTAGVAYLYLNQNDKRYLESCKVFFLVKDKLFLMSPLNSILDRGLDEIPEDYFKKEGM